MREGQRLTANKHWTVSRRRLLAGAGGFVMAATLGGSQAFGQQTTPSPAASTGGLVSLVFNKDNSTAQTKTVSTSTGSKQVTYHLYKGITYVAKPVDATYQSLNVSVPVEINGKAVDATNAPILFDINVGGYLASSVTGGTGASGGPPSGGANGSPPGGGAPPNGGASGVPADSGAMVNNGQLVSNADLALAAGYVVVSPGCRGRDNVTSTGKYYGKAPAAIVDLKSAVRYLRANKGRIPGNTAWIVASGTSAGGALSTLLAASGDNALYDPYLDEIGAADASDAIFASASYSPITDLDHADMAYEWMLGSLPLSSGKLVDQTVSKELSAAFADYQALLKLTGQNGFGAITANNYAAYLVKTYLEPAATKKLNAWSAATRASYLGKNPWITWSGNQATFTWAAFLAHVGQRLKNVPAFDAFNLANPNPENIEFGDATTNARHFTLSSLRHATGDNEAQLDRDLPAKITLMNPMGFIQGRNPTRAKHWWIRTGTLDTNTAHTVVGNLAASLENAGDDVNAAMYWDGGHGDNEDAAEFITWIGQVTGYT